MGVGNTKVWAALVLVAAVSASIAVRVMGATLDAGPAQAATGTRATPFYSLLVTCGPVPVPTTA